MKRELLKKIQLVVFGLIVLIAIAGCKKKAEPVKPQGDTNSVSATIEQTICPVMGGLVDKNVCVEYQGKKVYFCCPECKGQFEKNPEKYISKLPQFAK
jgi:YHS domain-containing protein